MTYKQAFDKITEAYIKGEIKPYDNGFCFCGTLSPDRDWRYPLGKRVSCQIRTIYHYHYRTKDYLKMEHALLETIRDEMGLVGDIFDPSTEDGSMIHLDDMVIYDGYEDALFSGMCAALEVLKTIHLDRGEVIDETPFVKRQLA